jgi:hypothetical protein
MKTARILHALLDAACLSERPPQETLSESIERFFEGRASDRANSLNPLHVHIYCGDTHVLVSAHVDVRVCFPDHDIDYLCALADLAEADIHHCGGGAAPAFVLVAAHRFEPVERLAYPGVS